MSDDGNAAVILRLRQALRRVRADISDLRSGWQTRTLQNIDEALREHPDPLPGWALVPLEPTPEAVAAWRRVKKGHQYAVSPLWYSGPTPTPEWNWPSWSTEPDASDYAAYRALVLTASGVDSRNK